MAFGINNITVVGNLTRDPELRFTPSGTPVTSIGIAVNRQKQNKATGEWTNELPIFYKVTAWYKLAENCAESLNKGDRILVTGTPSIESYETKDGQKRDVFKIIANVVAPSLEYAICKIEKNERAEFGSSAKGQYGDAGVEEKQGYPKAVSSGEDLDFSNDDIPF
jgi:single stranded DNA-binding protein (ssb)